MSSLGKVGGYGRNPNELELHAVMKDLCAMAAFLADMGMPFGELNRLLCSKESSCTESQLQRKLDAWGCVFDMKVAGLPKVGGVLTRTAGIITKTTRLFTHGNTCELEDESEGYNSKLV